MTAVSRDREFVGLQTRLATLGLAAAELQSAAKTEATSATSPATVDTIPKSRVLWKYSSTKFRVRMNATAPSTTSAFSWVTSNSRGAGRHATPAFVSCLTNGVTSVACTSVLNEYQL